MRGRVGLPIVVLVVPRKGDVDRNWSSVRRSRTGRVVPRKGDVDRNLYRLSTILDVQNVVPRKGDVDRNPLRRVRAEVVSSRPPQGGRG